MRALALAVTIAAAACATSTSSTPKADPAAAGRDDRDQNACLKMCEVAGDAEENKGAVADCKAACER